MSFSCHFSLHAISRTLPQDMAISRCRLRPLGCRDGLGMAVAFLRLLLGSIDRRSCFVFVEPTDLLILRVTIDHTVGSRLRRTRAI